MTGDHDDPTPHDEARPDEPRPDEPRPDEPRTVFIPATGFMAPTPYPVTPIAEQPYTAPPFTAPPFTTQPFVPIAGAEPRRIQVGDVLNHIFEVRRFIARGGMGEVFEGVNVNSDERVAIKVILPHLAADPAVLAMFRKEARTLTRLGHPALVAYRVLAQEPQLRVLYIVTEFVDGQNLSDILKDINAGPAELRMLTKRLAEGLAAAHALGAIHRDISPDNVMLPDGRLDHAKVIDFGIAKDLDASTGTIVGDGFAGKLNYVAPEQLGDFGREVGPWTDVYSLALTILAVARHRDVDMGATLVDAVDKRRAGPDLSPIPDELRPILEKMLAPNPVNRARSMEEVLQMLAGAPISSAAPAAPVSVAKKARPAKPARPVKEPSSSGTAAKSKVPLFAGGGLVLALLIGGVLWLAVGSHGSSIPATTAPGTTTSAPTDLAATARTALAAGLPGVPCTWLDLANVEVKGPGVSLAFRGVAGKPAEAQAVIGKLLSDKGLQAASIDFSDVSPIDAHECGPLEAFRKIRSPGGEHLTAAQRSFEMTKLGPDAGADAGKLGAQAILNVNLNGEGDDIALVGLEPSGTMTEFVTSKRDIADNPGIEKPQPGVYRINLTTTHMGWSGILMLAGKGPFDPALLNAPAGSQGPDWPAKFLKLAQERGWTSEMVWYRTVDEVPN